MEIDRAIRMAKEMIYENLEGILKNMVEDKEISHYSLSIDRTKPRKISIEVGIDKSNVSIDIIGGKK